MCVYTVRSVRVSLLSSPSSPLSLLYPFICCCSCFSCFSYCWQKICSEKCAQFFNVEWDRFATKVIVLKIVTIRVCTHQWSKSVITLQMGAESVCSSGVRLCVMSISFTLKTVDKTLHTGRARVGAQTSSSEHFFPQLPSGATAVGGGDRGRPFEPQQPS